MESLITLQPLQDADIKLVELWLRQDYILRWYQDTEDWLKEINERHQEYRFLHHFIVYFEGEPIGFCQYYDCIDAKESWYSAESRGEMFSIDYLIGEAGYLRKGFGKLIVMRLIEEMRKTSSCFEIVVQPDIDNIPSGKTLLANGFVFDENKHYFALKVKG